MLIDDFTISNAYNHHKTINAALAYISIGLWCLMPLPTIFQL